MGPPPHQAQWLHLPDASVADAALGTHRTAHGTAGAAALLPGSAFALFACAEAGAGAGDPDGAGTAGSPFHPKVRNEVQSR